jgi:hypothetical protein
VLLSDREISEFAWLTSEPAQVPSGKSERFTSGWPKKMAVATQSQAEQTACFLHHLLAFLYRLFQFFLVISQQSMNFAVRFVADSVNLRRKLLPRSVRILAEQRLNLVMVLPKQRPDLLLLFPESTPDLL